MLRFLLWAFEWDVGASDEGEIWKREGHGGLYFPLGNLLGYLPHTPVSARELASPLNSGCCKGLTFHLSS